MLAEDYRRLLLRDVEGLRRQIEAYPDEATLWSVVPGVANPPGNLALHIAGNLRTYVGNDLGGIAYERDRDAEFSDRDVPRQKLLEGLDLAARIVDEVLPGVEDARLAEPFPRDFGGFTLPTGRFLAHLCTHLAYHLGQVDLHRRWTTGQGAVEGIVGFGPLRDRNR